MAKRYAPKKEDEALRLRVKPGDQLSISIRVEAPPQAAKPGKPATAKKPGVFARAAAAVRAFFQRQKVSAFFKKAFSPMGLFIIGCALFTLTRFIRLPDFPLYFSCDEANIALRGLDLVGAITVSIQMDFSCRPCSSMKMSTAWEQRFISKSCRF